mgnify:CR=1 FL=1
MNISYNWLKEYIEINESPEALSKILTDLGLEIGGIKKRESIKGGLGGLVIGEVVEKFQHPNADKLSCTKVNVGGDALLSIVCGAPNVEASSFSEPTVITWSTGPQLNAPANPPILVDTAGTTFVASISLT